MLLQALRAEFGPMLRLAVPVVTVQLGLMAMGVVDTMMVGRVSPVALAAVALGNLYFFNALIFPFGVLTALDPLFSQAVGAGDHAAVARDLRRGLALAFALAIPFSLVQWPAARALAWAGQPAEVVPDAAAYVHASIPGVFPFLAFLVLRQALQALSRTGPVVVAILGGNVLNVLLNAVLIYGAGPVPALGAVGSAWASTISRWAMVLGLLAAGDELRRLVFARAPGAAALPLLARTLRLGSPIGAQYLLEIGAFGVVGLLMGRLGTVEVAAHQVTLNLASLTFMVPLGVATAAAVRVGHAVGRMDPPGPAGLPGSRCCWGPGSWRSAPRLPRHPGRARRGLHAPRAGGGAGGDAPAHRGRVPGVRRPAGRRRRHPAGARAHEDRDGGQHRGVLGLRHPRLPGPGLPSWPGTRGTLVGAGAGLAGVAVVLLWRVRVGLRGRLRRLAVDDVSASQLPAGPSRWI